MEKRALIFCTLSLVVAAGCQRENIESPSSGRSIRPVVTAVAGTKAESGQDAGRQIAAIPIYENPGDSLFILVYEKDMPDYQSDACATKGSESTTATLSKFYMKAYAEEEWHDNETNATSQAGAYFGVPTAVTVTKGTSDWTMSPEQKWLNGVPTSFWSWNEVEPVINPANGYDKASFTYTVADAVTSQKDLVFAYNGENVTFSNAGAITRHDSTNAGYNRTDDQMDIRFYHALSAIRFDISGVQGSTVDKITIGGVASGGTCDIAVGTDGVPSFTWSNLAEAKSYSQDFVAADFDATSGRQVAGSDKEFLMIPQALPATATLTVKFSGTDSQPKSIGGVTWEAGKYYTYKLSKSAYTWNYIFYAGRSEWTFNNNKDSEKPVTFNITSYRVRSDDRQKTEYVNWKIKSYKIGNGSEVPVNASSLAYDPTWIKASIEYKNTPSETDPMTVTAKQIDILAKGKHDYWVNTAGRTDDLDWSPEDWSSKGTIDLSKLDAYSKEYKTTNSMTTANCYIVRHAGTYRFPLVYGNAIVEGQPNTKSYNTSKSSSGRTNALDVFVNHKNANITDPFIENNDGCVADKAVLLGESEVKNVTDVKLVGDRPTSKNQSVSKVRYVEFTVKQEAIAQNNAMIAIEDGSGNVIWSWHIWITNNPDVVADPIEVTNWDNHKYYFLPANNIGTIDYAYYISRKDKDIVLTLEQDSPSTKTVKVTLKQEDFEMKTSALIYEWGRKDPFINKSVDLSGNSFNYLQDRDCIISWGIKNPMTWYGHFPNVGGQSWAKTMYANLWTGIESASASGNTDILVEQSERTIKTIYDPSPVGFMVPPNGAFTGFNTVKFPEVGNNPKENWNVVSTKFDNGYEFYTSLGPNHTVNTGGPTIRFHADGIRAGDGGEYKENRGYYYSSIVKSPSDSWHVYDLLIDDGGFTPSGSASTANGHCIRPIRE